MLELRAVTKRYSGIAAVQNVSFVARAGEVTGYLGPERLRQIHHPENDHRPHRAQRRRDSLSRPAGGPRPHGLPPDARLCSRRAASLPAPHRRRVPGDGGPICAACRSVNSPRRSTASCACSRSTRIATCPFRPTPRACGRKSCSSPRCCTIPSWCCSTSLSPASTSIPRWCCATSSANWPRRGKVVLFSSHELETVERVCSRVVILHKGRVVANDSIEQLRALMSLPTLEEIFSQLAIEQDTPAITRQIVQLMELEWTPHPRLVANGIAMPEERRQFRILYRDFLFRILDLELLASRGEAQRLLSAVRGPAGRVQLHLHHLFRAALRPFHPALGQTQPPGVGGPGSARLPPPWRWPGCSPCSPGIMSCPTAAIAWCSACLPVRPRTIFLAKLAALGHRARRRPSAALNVFTGLAYPVRHRARPAAGHGGDTARLRRLLDGHVRRRPVRLLRHSLAVQAVAANPAAVIACS